MGRPWARILWPTATMAFSARAPIRLCNAAASAIFCTAPGVMSSSMPHLWKKFLDALNTASTGSMKICFRTATLRSSRMMALSKRDRNCGCMP